MHGAVSSRRSGLPLSPISKPPFPLKAGASFPVYFTIQPGGLTFNTAAGAANGNLSNGKGVQIYYQNATNSKAGSRFDFLSYDPFRTGWHAYGRGRVSSDKSKIVPDPGTQLWTFDGVQLSSSSGPPAVGPNSCSTSDGDSVDLQTGLFVLGQTDLALPGSTPLAVSRSYRQGDGGIPQRGNRIQPLSGYVSVGR